MLALAVIKHVPRRFARHIFTGRVHQVTPGVAVDFRINRQANFYVDCFFAQTVKRNAARCRRNIHGAFIFAWQDRDVLARRAVFRDGSINRSLNRGMRYALRTCRANHEVRLFRQVNRRRGPRRSVRIHRREVVRTVEVLRFISGQNRAGGGTGRDLLRRALIRWG